MKFKESGITFSFDPGNYRVWQPEMCESHKAMSGVKMADFMIEKDEKAVFLVEVKTSAPKKPDDFLTEIAVKIRCMLCLFAGIQWKRVDDDGAEIPREWTKKTFLKKPKWRCVLFVKDHKHEWLHGLQDSMNTHPLFGELRQLFNLQQAICINYDKAKKTGWAE